MGYGPTQRRDLGELLDFQRSASSSSRIIHLEEPVSQAKVAGGQNYGQGAPE